MPAPKSDRVEQAPDVSGPAPLSPQEVVKIVEERRKSAEGILWQLPAVSLTAQSFLLSAGLGRDAEQESQVIVGALGVVAVGVTAFVVLFQALRATTLGHWLGKAIKDSLAPESLGRQVDDLNPLQERMLQVRNVFYFPWVIAFAAFLLADIYVLAKGLGA